MQLGYFNCLAALHDAQVREPLLAAARVVLHRGVVLDDAADDLEEGDAAGEGIGHGFEDHGGAGLVIVDSAERRSDLRGRIAGGHGLRNGRLHGDGRALDRRWARRP